METAHEFSFQKLDVYRATKELAARVHRARIADAELRDQAARASKSAFLCLAEGLPNEGAGMRRKYFVMANNSLHEAVAAVDLAAAIGALALAEAEAIQAIGLRVKRMLRALMR
jgi:four helix bundle protein